MSRETKRVISADVKRALSEWEWIRKKINPHAKKREDKDVSEDIGIEEAAEDSI